MHLGRAYGPHRRGASVIYKAALILEGKAAVLAGNQPGASDQIWMNFHDGRSHAGYIAQPRFFARQGGEPAAPAFPHVGAHPQALLLPAPIGDAEAGEALCVRPFARRVVFILIEFTFQPGNGAKIGVQRFLFQIPQQNAQTIRRFRRGAPVFQLGDIIAEKQWPLIVCNQIF